MFQRYLTLLSFYIHRLCCFFFFLSFSVASFVGFYCFSGVFIFDSGGWMCMCEELMRQHEIIIFCARNHEQGNFCFVGLPSPRSATIVGLEETRASLLPRSIAEFKSLSVVSPSKLRSIHPQIATLHVHKESSSRQPYPTTESGDIMR